MRERLTEPSSMAGIGMVAYSLSLASGYGQPEQAEQIATAAANELSAGNWFNALLIGLTGAAAIYLKEGQK
ncbi:hypothetical protein PsW64_03816 [Pseudovibrio sp. W64]|uniref:hypothetical protein n=1 Tax=Pseudovibrio sp. W64 TaxID=1735583 RepID=UPI0007B2339E|nr:hypothetical protein [Pseudovibrio sp. W64]KZK78177.1 hypothetical protein PsW64_03816 [Pseudovibrio sp. W64]